MDGAPAVIALRFATGAALACVYPPGLKIAAGWFLERRGTALGVVVGALTIGSAFPHLLAWGAHGVPWRVLMWLSSSLALAGGCLVLTAVEDGPYVARVGAVRSACGAGRSSTIRGVRLATLGYLGHMWELYAMWTWIPAFAAASIAARGGGAGRMGSLVAFVAIASGAVGCVVAGRWADAWGKARVAGLAMVVSAACAASTGLVYGGPLAWLFLLAVVWGFSVVADSAQFSALVSEFSGRTARRDRADASDVRGISADDDQHAAAAGRRGSAIGWQWAFLVLVPGPVAGAAIMLRSLNATPSTARTARTQNGLSLLLDLPAACSCPSRSTGS